MVLMLEVFLYISVENKAGHSSLHSLNSAGVVLSVEIPDGRGVHIINKIVLEQRLDIIMYYMYTHKNGERCIMLCENRKSDKSTHV